MNETSQHYYLEFRNQFIRKIKSIIIVSCGKRRGENFKLNVPIIELIDYKRRYSSEEEKFQFYVTAITSIIDDLTTCFPQADFIDVNLNSTPQEIINLIMDIYDPITKEE